MPREEKERNLCRRWPIILLKIKNNIWREKNRYIPPLWRVFSAGRKLCFSPAGGIVVTIRQDIVRFRDARENSKENATDNFRSWLSREAAIFRVNSPKSFATAEYDSPFFTSHFPTRRKPNFFPIHYISLFLGYISSVLVICKYCGTWI